ncbi:hypothetical protein [Facilibium subflavum]|uniref:hypothetical protein n=1 Tax=Facilibium subflavum TaxID=2219058 RepID=UPI000E65E9B2|nr:hypothetical protein [Facilibium subflavum]
MKNLTVESKIRSEYNCSIIDFFQKCIDQKMDAHEIAALIDCSVSNLRRIARKYKFTFHRPEPSPMLSQSAEFLTNSITVNNFLSRRWIQQSSFVTA